MRTVDWLVVGSGFGGSVAALRLAELGYDVELLECGRRFTDEELPRSTWDLRKYVWSPRLGMRGILRTTFLKDVAIVSGAGVGGGSLVYACTLYRPKRRFYENPQWAGLSADWEAELAPYYQQAERMLGVTTYDEEDDASALLRRVGARLGVEHTHTRTPVGIFLGEQAKTVPDPYFGGDGPDRTGCVRCSECHLGCRFGAKNTLEKNYVYFAERLGVRIRPERMVVDVRPAGAADGSDGYQVTSVRPGAWVRRRPEVIHANGVVFAAGPLGTNRLLADCRDRGSLPRLSARLGEQVRTNSEALYAVTLPRKHGMDLTRRAVITASIHPDEDTHVEFDSFGRAGDAMAPMFGPLVGAGSRLSRLRQALSRVVRHPLEAANAAWPFGWSARTMILLVMQDLDNAIALRLRKRGALRWLQSEQDGANPIPTHLRAAEAAVLATADLTGGVPQSAISDVLLGRPATAHLLGGAVIGRGPDDGVIDTQHRIFGYQRLLITDGAAVPANPGVNPALTITAMAERAMTFVPPKGLYLPEINIPATAP